MKYIYVVKRYFYNEDRFGEKYGKYESDHRYFSSMAKAKERVNRWVERRTNRGDRIVEQKYEKDKIMIHIDDEKGNTMQKFGYVSHSIFTIEKHEVA